MDATIQIARTSGMGADDVITVSIVQGSNHIRVALTLEQFGNLMSGSAHVSCKVVRWSVKDGIYRTEP